MRTKQQGVHLRSISKRLEQVSEQRDELLAALLAALPVLGAFDKQASQPVPALAVVSAAVAKAKGE